MKIEPPRPHRSEPAIDELLQRLIAADMVTPPAQGLSVLAKNLVTERRVRDAYFSPALFGEPAWDILLALQIDGANAHRVTLSALPIPSPSSTAHRHIVKLQDAGLVECWREASDLRCRRIKLTPSGAQAMQGYLAQIALNRAL